MIHLTSNLLHPDGIGWSVHDANSRSVPAERGTGKGIYLMQFRTHDNGIAF